MATGITGMTGLQGLRGLQGPPRYAFRGPPFGYTSARITTSTPTNGSDKIYLTPQNLGTWFNITSALFVDNNSGLTIYLPGYDPIYGVGPTGTISSAVGFTTYITYTTSTPVAEIGLRANAVVSIAGNDPPLNNPASANLPTLVRVLPEPNGPTGNTFSVAYPTDNCNSTAGTARVQETTAVETTNEAFPTPEQAGNFWLFKNNDSQDRTVTFSNGVVTYDGNDLTTSLTLERSHKMTVLYTGSNFIVL
jgi:hypothetical protein